MLVKLADCSMARLLVLTFFSLFYGLARVQGWATNRTERRLAAQAKQATEEKLRQDLFSHYSKQIRSLHKLTDHPHSDSVPIFLFYHLTKILELDEKKEQLSVAVYLDISWTDDRLQWNSSEYQGVPWLEVKLKEIWYPNIVFSNGIRDITPLKDSHLVRVLRNGVATSAGVWQMTSPCEMDITYFPLDIQVCTQQFRLQPANPDPAVIGVWALPSMSFQLDVALYNDSTWFINRYQDIRITNENTFEARMAMIELTLTRRYEYYINRILAPVTILAVLVMVGFFIPPDAGEKIGFGVTLLLTFSVFQTMIDADLPASSMSTPLLTTAMIRLQVCSAMSIVASVIVLNFHHIGSEYGGKMPRWLNFIFFTILAKITFRTGLANELQKNKALEPKEVYKTKPEDDENNTPDGQSRILHKIFDLYSQLAATENSPNEWKVAAMIVDRLLMYACLLAITVFYAHLLVQFQRIAGQRPRDEIPDDLANDTNLMQNIKYFYQYQNLFRL